HVQNENRALREPVEHLTGFIHGHRHLWGIERALLHPTGEHAGFLSAVARGEDEQAAGDAAEGGGQRFGRVGVSGFGGRVVHTVHATGSARMRHRLTFPTAPPAVMMPPIIPRSPPTPPPCPSCLPAGRRTRHDEPAMSEPADSPTPDNTTRP